jgi:hypothetical protein
MPKPMEYIPVEPFRSWLNERYAEFEEGTDVAGVLGPSAQVCELIGWSTEESSCRRLYRFRRGISETRVGGRKGRSRTTTARGFDRIVVEDALHAAGEDFYDFYPEYAHERNGGPEPEAWCPNCADHVLVVHNKAEEPVCVWCDWKISDGHLNRGLVAA